MGLPVTYHWARLDPAFFKAGAPTTFKGTALQAKYHAFPAGFLASLCFALADGDVPKAGWPLGRKRNGHFFLEALDPTDFGHYGGDFDITVSADFTAYRLDGRSTPTRDLPGFPNFALTDLYVAGYEGPNFAFSGGRDIPLTSHDIFFIPALTRNVTVFGPTAPAPTTYPYWYSSYEEDDISYDADYAGFPDPPRIYENTFPGSATLANPAGDYVVLFGIDVQILPRVGEYAFFAQNESIQSYTWTDPTGLGAATGTPSPGNSTVTYPGQAWWRAPFYKVFTVYGLARVNPTTRMP